MFIVEEISIINLCNVLVALECYQTRILGVLLICVSELEEINNTKMNVNCRYLILLHSELDFSSFRCNFVF